MTIPVLFGLVFLVFFLSRIVPGDPCRAVLGEKATERSARTSSTVTGSTSRSRSSSRIYLNQLAHGDLGTSIKFSRPVTESSSSGSRRRSS